MVTSVKDRILETAAQLPPTATVEDAMERLHFLAKLERGTEDLNAGRVVSHDEIKSAVAVDIPTGAPGGVLSRSADFTQLPIWTGATTAKRRLD